MSLQVSKKSGTLYHPVFLDILNDIPGGITLKTNRFPTTTDEIKKGAMLNASASSVGLYNLVKTAKVKSTITGVTISVYPQHEFVVGDFIGIPGKGTAATIDTITKGTGTDIILLPSSVGVCATNTILRECGAAVNTGAAVLYDTDAILRDTVKVRDDDDVLLDNVFAGAVVRAEVDESMLPYFVTDQQKTDLTARIRFS